MARTQWTPKQRAEAVRLVAKVGHAEAARRTGVPKGTVASWAHRAGVTAEAATAATVQAVEAKVASIAERKAALAEGLMDDIVRLGRDLFAGTVERKVIASGPLAGEIVDITHKTTTHAERRTGIEAIAKAIETVQLLTGGATARTEQLTAKQAAIEEARERGLRLVS